MFCGEWFGVVSSKYVSILGRYYAMTCLGIVFHEGGSFDANLYLCG